MIVEIFRDWQGRVAARLRLEDGERPEAKERTIHIFEEHRLRVTRPPFAPDIVRSRAARLAEFLGCKFADNSGYEG